MPYNGDRGNLLPQILQRTFLLASLFVSDCQAFSEARVFLVIGPISLFFALLNPCIIWISIFF